MSKFGRLDEFHSDSESVAAYIERVQLYFIANEVKDEKQVPVFLSSVGATTYALLRDLVSPEKPKDKTLDALFKVLENHYSPAPLVIAERYNFHKRSQTASESVSEYIAVLRKLATHCKFEAFLNDALRDRFVWGLHDASIQKRLLMESKLTLDMAIEIAQGLESAERSSRKLQSDEHTPISRITKSKDPKTQFQKPCYRCGGSHTPDSCRFRDAECHKCRKRGHIACVCRSSHPKSGGMHKSKKVHMTALKPMTPLHQPEEDDLNESENLSIFQVQDDSRQPITVELQIEGQVVKMEVDTGAAVSLMSSTQYNRIFPHLRLQHSSSSLSTYSGEQLKLVGERKMEVKYNSQCKNMVLHVVEGDGPSLLGRDWLRHIKLDWRSIGLTLNIVNKDKSRVDTLLSKYSGVFEEGLSAMNSFKARLHLKQGSRPKFCKARPVPFALRPAVEAELTRLEEQGVIKPVRCSEWATPVVPVPKKDGRLRLCGDYKITVNPAIEIDQYPLPKPEDLFASLARGTKFSKIDLTSAYQRLCLDEESQGLTTVNTHKGLYKYTRLPFGVASAPAMFQQVMDTVLQGLPNVICYLDDVLVTGSTVEEHLSNLEGVLKRLQQHNIRAKKSKCFFLCDSTEYLGHRVDAKGLHTTDDKVKAVQNAPVPKNVQELRSFLGLIHYYGKFLPNLSTLLHPLNTLLQTNSSWEWTQQCSEAFVGAKKLLCSAPVLAHYNPSLPLKLAGDASSYGLGAVISHVMPDGSERPVAFASRTLSSSERNYPQIEKEALSLIFGLRRFHQYVYGRKFTLITDHKPLVTLLGPKTGVPSLAAARLQRWALFLSSHRYEIQYKCTQDHANADGLSRLPLQSNVSSSECVFTIGQIQALPTTAEHIARETQRDSKLSRVYRYVIDGWPKEVSEDLRVFRSRQNELSTEGHCLMWGTRVIVPDKLRAPLLRELHRGHPGISRMKAVARSYLWWPGVDKELEDLVSNCQNCQSNRHNPPPAPLHPWAWPSRPWERVHFDFAGPFLGRMYLIAVDAHSKWPEVVEMSSTTAVKTINVLRHLFATYGLPRQVVTDNGPQFTAEEFSRFLKSNGVKHITSTPYHPSTNGLAERFVQTFKAAMRAGASDIADVQHRLDEFLLSYRATPHATTSRSPSELFLGRQVRTRLHLVRPNCQSQVLDRQMQQKMDHDKRCRLRDLSTGQRVMVRNYRSSERWVPGMVVQKLGPLTYSVLLDSGILWRRHIDQLRQTGEDMGAVDTGQTDFCLTSSPTECSQEQSQPSEPEEQPSQTDSQPVTSSSTPSSSSRRYPVRVRKPPQWYSPLITH